MTEEEKWVQTCIRHKAWARAIASHIKDGMNEDAEYKRCVKSRDINGMSDNCWTTLIAEYPQN